MDREPTIEIQIRELCPECHGSEELETVEYSHGREITKSKKDWCPTCDSGYVYKWVSLEEVLKLGRRGDGIYTSVRVNHREHPLEVGEINEANDQP